MPQVNLTPASESPSESEDQPTGWSTTTQRVVITLAAEAPQLVAVLAWVMMRH